MLDRFVHIAICVGYFISFFIDLESVKTPESDLLTGIEPSLAKVCYIGSMQTLSPRVFTSYASISRFGKLASAFTYKCTRDKS